MTLSKLARLANVSISVVSKAFSGKGGISEAMREHVFAVAKEHGCFHKFYHARYDKPVIAVIIPEAISNYYIEYVEILKAHLEESGYTMLLSISSFDRALTDELVRYYTSHSKVDGLIVVDSEFTAPEKSETAIVSVSADTSICTANASVIFSVKEGLSEALLSLVSLGHKRIAFVGEPLTSDKADTFRCKASSLGIEGVEELIYTSYMRFSDAGRDGVEHLFSLSEPPTAIIGAYGYITEGIISALTERGLSIPEDVSVISLDAHPHVMYNGAPVSHITSGIEELCARAIEILRSRLDGENKNLDEKINVTVRSAFRPSESIGRVRRT